jgi:hypothetical protein
MKWNSVDESKNLETESAKKRNGQKNLFCAFKNMGGNTYKYCWVSGSNPPPPKWRIVTLCKKWLDMKEELVYMNRINYVKGTYIKCMGNYLRTFKLSTQNAICRIIMSKQQTKSENYLQMSYIVITRCYTVLNLTQPH